MNKRYIDLNSAFRDRKLYPNPGEFGVRLAQSGNGTTIITSKNPITLAYPYKQWQWGCALTSGAQTGATPAPPPSGVGLALGGVGGLQPPTNSRISWRRGTGTNLQPMPSNTCTLGVLASTVTNNMTRSNGFFNGLIYQSKFAAPANAADYNTARITDYKAHLNQINDGGLGGGPAFAGIITVDSAMPSWDAGGASMIENNSNSAAALAGWEVGSEVFIPNGFDQDGIYVGDTYEAIMYQAIAAPAGEFCHQFRTITAYDGTRKVATLNAPLVQWISPANDNTAGGAGGAIGCTYLHRLRRGLPLLPQESATLAAPNMPLTRTNNIQNAIYSVAIVNAGTGYVIGTATITATTAATLNILSVTPAGGVTSVSIAIPGVQPNAGFQVGQILPLVGGVGINCTILITGVGFGVNVQGAVGITNASDLFTNQFFYVPALNQPASTPTGTAFTDPSAAQQFIPQTGSAGVISVTPNPASPYFNQPYTADTSACAVIRGDFFDAVGPTHVLVIEPFRNAFPAAGFEFNILPYTRDEVVPMNYTGSTVSQSQMVCYQMTLESITLPNVNIEVFGVGGIIAFYPFVYVEFRNVSAPSAGVNPLLYSNNPASQRALFKCSITDTPTPTISRFIKISGDGMQTVKFKPNDDLYVRVILPNGATFTTIAKDTAPPLEPNVLLQISLTVGIERL